MAMSTRCELVVKEVFISKANWDDIENLFMINRHTLMEELSEAFKKFPDGKLRLAKFKMQMAQNEKHNHRETVLTDDER